MIFLRLSIRDNTDMVCIRFVDLFIILSKVYLNRKFKRHPECRPDKEINAVQENT